MFFIEGICLLNQYLSDLLKTDYEIKKITERLLGYIMYCGNNFKNKFYSKNILKNIFVISSFFVIFSFLTSSCSSIEVLKRSPANGDLLPSKDEISLLTYNLEAISAKEDDQIDNFIKFVNSQQYDFVLLQELFSEGTRTDIVEKADANHFNTIISRVDYFSFPEFFFQDSGLFLMSRFPNVDLSGINFGDDIKNCDGIIYMILGKEFSRTYDFLANKSVLGALFQISENKKLFLFTTHLQALGTNENKEYQLLQISEFIRTAIQNTFSSGIIGKNEELTVILAGDFNIDAYNNTWSQNRVIHSRLLKLLGNPRDLHKEFNGEKREYTWNFNSNSYPRRFDYVFAYDSVAGRNLKKLSVKEMNVVDIQDDKNNSISDHRGISARLQLESLPMK